ncbi:hypothetical protein JXO59_09320 [candidate division KSB1 bacterium]|nr:hypothetical protein [candidate division KSB1 bacterium]
MLFVAEFAVDLDKSNAHEIHSVFFSQVKIFPTLKVEHICRLAGWAPAALDGAQLEIQWKDAPHLEGEAHRPTPH